MRSPGVARFSLEFLVEPAFLLLRRGDILNVNSVARRMLRSELVGHNLFDYVESSHEEFDGYLRRSSGSTAPLIGSASLRTRDGVGHYRLYCAALHGSGESALVLRCISSRDNQFSVLARQVRHLNRELHVRLREKAALEEAVLHNQHLMRELEHRVKNNVQMMASLIQMSVGRSQSEESRRLLDALHLKLQAMASAQGAIYRSKQHGTVAVESLLHEIVTLVGQSLDASSRLRADIADVELSNEVAHVLALIANELLTNAIKHGRGEDGGSIRVSFGPVDDRFELVVHDSGPGFATADSADGSGLRLVRGLCRQIGGSLEISYDRGARCSVRFKAD